SINSLLYNKQEQSFYLSSSISEHLSSATPTTWCELFLLLHTVSLSLYTSIFGVGLVKLGKERTRCTITPFLPFQRLQQPSLILSYSLYSCAICWLLPRSR